MSLFPDTSGGYYDDTGHWQRLKYCFVSCGAACTCMPPGGLDYNPLHDKSKQCAHADVRWAADGVDGTCKGCGETVVPHLKSLPPQSD